MDLGVAWRSGGERRWPAEGRVRVRVRVRVGVRVSARVRVRVSARVRATLDEAAQDRRVDVASAQGHEHLRGA